MHLVQRAGCFVAPAVKGPTFPPRRLGLSAEQGRFRLQAKGYPAYRIAAVLPVMEAGCAQTYCRNAWGIRLLAYGLSQRAHQYRRTCRVVASNISPRTVANPIVEGLISIRISTIYRTLFEDHALTHWQNLPMRKSSSDGASVLIR